MTRGKFGKNYQLLRFSAIPTYLCTRDGISNYFYVPTYLLSRVISEWKLKFWDFTHKLLQWILNKIGILAVTKSTDFVLYMIFYALHTVYTIPNYISNWLCREIIDCLDVKKVLKISGKRYFFRNIAAWPCALWSHFKILERKTFLMSLLD